MQQRNVTSLQYKFAGVDWSLAGNRKCEGLGKREWETGGMEADVMETVFVRLTAKQVVMGWEGAYYANTAANWMDAALSDDVKVDSNSGIADRNAVASALYCFHSRLLPVRCFDEASYLTRNQDLVRHLKNCALENQCWQHFAYSGVTESRYGTFTCDLHATRNLSALVTT